MVLHIGYVYLILIETGLKTILAILRIVYLEENYKICWEEIGALLRCKEPVIKVVINPVQQLGNEVNCGVFAIAYARH